MLRLIKYLLCMKIRRSCSISCLLVCVLQAQDADTIVLKNDNQKFTLVSQIEDREEASAFLAILSTRSPQGRYARAIGFLKYYAQSWLLPQAYDALARSAIDLEKYDEALEAGRFSLRLLPENPSLLILLANVEVAERVVDKAMPMRVWRLNT